MKLFHFFGDSVTLGVNDAPAGGWVARLAGKAAAAGLSVPPDTFYNMGVRKNSSRMILERWEAEFRARTMEGVPSFLLFCFYCSKSMILFRDEVTFLFILDDLVCSYPAA